MSSRVCVLMTLGAVLASMAGAAQATDLGDVSPVVAREARWAHGDADHPLPPDLLRPEGRTRWDAESLVSLGTTVSRLELATDDSGTVERVDRGEGDDRLRLLATRFEAAGGSDAALRWTLPQRFDLADPAPRAPLELVRRGPDGAVALRIETRRAGLGWLFLPSGPRQVVLERALISTGDPATRAFEVSREVHRWIDPRAGVVLEIGGPAGADGARTSVDEVRWVEDVTRGVEPLRFYWDEFDSGVLERIGYGLDRGQNTAVSSLTPDGHATIGDLIAATSWDFSANTFATATNEVASTKVPINQQETCNYNQCGFTGPAAQLGREDVNFEDPDTLTILLSVQEPEVRANDVTLWLRAGVQNEGATGGLAEGESRFCYSGTDSGGRVRPAVPLWRFPNEDSPGAGFYFTAGDTWANDTPFNCEQSVFNHVCPNSCGFLCPIWIKGCSGSPTQGLQMSTVLHDGTVSLPSGHTFEAILVKNVVDFCAYLSNTCNFPVQNVRTVNYFWMVPNLGTVVRLRSALNTPDDTTFTTVRDTDIKFGLFPPRSLTVGAVGDTSVELSWDPGLDVRRHDGYRIYWDTNSGAVDDYAQSESSLDVMPGDVAFSPCTQNPDDTYTCTATVGGLTPGVEYFFTVTSLSLYTDPTSAIESEYESPAFPIMLGSPTPVPAEVSATTTGGACVPTDEVTGLTAALNGSQIDFCWDASADACLEYYTILGSDAVETDAGFAAVGTSAGLATCATVDGQGSYFLVIGSSAGGDGPWGHYPLP